MDDDDEVLDTPDRVSWSVAAGVWPLPLLGVYAVLFIAHGLIFPVQPPDVGNSNTAEAVAGFVALALLGVGILTIMWFLNRRRRWPFVLGQVATALGAGFFLFDPRTQSWAVPAALLLTSLTAIVLAFAPESAAYVRSSVAWPWARKQITEQRERDGYVGRRRAAAAAEAAAPVPVPDAAVPDAPTGDLPADEAGDGAEAPTVVERTAD